jgi:hypothetical protein
MSGLIDLVVADSRPLEDRAGLMNVVAVCGVPVPGAARVGAGWTGCDGRGRVRRGGAGDPVPWTSATGRGASVAVV